MTEYRRFAAKFGEIEIYGPDLDDDIEVTINKHSGDDATVWVSRETALLMAGALERAAKMET